MTNNEKAKKNHNKGRHDRRENEFSASCPTCKWALAAWASLKDIDGRFGFDK